MSKPAQAKFHINPNTGNPNICRAEKGGCPFGGESEHYPSKEEARKAFELIQSGSFLLDSSASRPLPDGYPLKGKGDLEEAPLGTLVEFSNGIRFLKTAQNTWETSQEGGLELDNAALLEYPKAKGIKRWSNVVAKEEKAAEQQQPKPALKRESGKASVRAELLQHASFEEGKQARRYFLLLNHRNPEQLEAAKGTVKDQKLVADVEALNEVVERQEELERALESAKSSYAAAKTEAQQAGYQKVVETKLRQLEELQPKLEEATKTVDGHMKRYAKQLVIHRRSLDSLERLASQGVKSNPPGIKERVEKLEQLQKETRSVKELVEETRTHKPDRILGAAVAFGNPLYIRQAEAYKNAADQIDALNDEAAQLQRTFNETNRPAIQEAVQKELQTIQRKQEVAQKRFARSRQEIALFEADLRARFDQEQDISRELKALKTLQG